MDELSIRAKMLDEAKIKPKIKKQSEDEQILEWLKPLAETLEISVQELVLNLHEQKIFEFDNVKKLLRIIND